MTPLAKRECGACTVCCTALKIDTPQLRKPADVRCRHLDMSGCGIYAMRPPVCRTFLCGWRLFAELSDDWRPDKSGVLVARLAPEEVPPDYRAPGYGLEIAVTGGEAAVARPGLAAYVARLLARGVAVRLSAASPAILLNEHLEAGLTAAEIHDRLVALYPLLHAARFRRGPLRIAALYRLQVVRQRAFMEKRLNHNS